MKVNTSDKITITDNTVEQIKAIDDGVRFTILGRSKGNGSNPDSVIVLNPKEFRELVNWGRGRLFARYE